MPSNQYIAQVPYRVLLNQAFLRKVHATADHLIHMLRMATTQMPVSFWDANEDVARRGKIIEEGMDCFYMPFGLLGQGMHVIEITPYPRGYLRFTVRGDNSTCPDPGDPNTLVFSSDLVAEAPTKTREDMQIIKGFDLEDKWPSLRTSRWKK